MRKLRLREIWFLWDNMKIKESYDSYLAHSVTQIILCPYYLNQTLSIVHSIYDSSKTFSLAYRYTCMCTHSHNREREREAQLYSKTKNIFITISWNYSRSTMPCLSSLLLENLREEHFTPAYLFPLSH